ncbi:dynamin-like protein, putative [Plasmodium knowlesi strain H]|uniref:Dynamin-like protein, putative n=3 Tax=Plasmodium knowlesi TaxID=5850 RepID=A0A5K1VT74_PLAKH|nr:dynamin-like protein, putative [Plasmodium knowlesi strain H]OTN65069.1 putative Dynamin protein [Plasmodium knowlesi]CAA9988476.1 dynamin-like protein, putative [Plasmodium knowlesi strain H]SBO19756.1 dynamin-like protein, putative [Plasmodium knowlesi strain H]SBO20477.1 dynamin-like protein, putative [Plasmodium knowlesi strain H]VVS77950.1 dynamin-like protein, putative [Plasmodium knowlesi strain H]|eukprot:XP_002259457.1 dynamin protein, putative [Plasmodium knowlesi strain H]
MESSMYNNLRKLITVIDELRDIGLQKYINLPRICVVGTQSSGKSSVLESIVGLDFLPRGEGIVTRRPIEFRLIHIKEDSEIKHWAIFEDDKSKKFTDFNKVREHINNLTDELAGKNKGIIDEPIVLNIYSTSCPDLSLIDLPGITRVPLKNSDQTDDIERLTREMAFRYVKDPRTIILAVLPANADMSTSDALQIARKVDPKGLRTIGVITKIDLMDKGADASKMLMNDEITLRLGYTGVVNRSTADIKSGKSIAQSLKDELKFFQNHPVYKKLPPTLYGTTSLTDKLTKVLLRHIKNFLPDIKIEINDKIRLINDKLYELGTNVPLDATKKTQLLWSMITDYCEIFKNTLKGKYDKRLQVFIENNDIICGLKVRSIFNEFLDEYVGKNVTSELTDNDIDDAICLHEGDSLPGFPSPDTFEFLILPHLKKINAPVFHCLDKVTQTLEILSQKIANRVLARFPKLSEQVLDLSQTILLREKENTHNILENFIDAETNYLFTNDSSYLIEHGSIINANEDDPNNESTTQDFNSQQRLQNKRQQSNISNSNIDNNNMQSKYYSNMMSDQEYITGKAAKFVSTAQKSVMNMWNAKEKKKTRYNAQFIQEIRRRLDCYFNIVLRNVRDSVPKIIGYFLIRKLQEKMQFELYSDLNSEQKLYDLLNEPPHVVKEREHLNRQLDILKKANQVLMKDPNITSINLDLFDANYEQDLIEFQKSLKTNNVQSAAQTYKQTISSSQGSMHSMGDGPSISKRNPMMQNRNASPTSMNSNTMKSSGMMNQKMPSSTYMQQNLLNDSKGKHLFEKEPMKKKVQYNPLFD